MKLLWGKWLYGLASGFIGGGAGAVVAGGMAAMLAPDQFSPLRDLPKFLTLVGSTFLANGLMSAFLYLKQSPLPPTDDTRIFKNSNLPPKSTQPPKE